MRILLVSSKFPPEYSGSGLRASKLYIRLKKKYNINYDVITSSEKENLISYKSSLNYNIKTISIKLPKIYLKNRNIFKKFFVKIYNYLVQQISFIIELFFFIFHIIFIYKKYDLIHIFGNNNITTSTLLINKILKKKVIIEIVNFDNKIVFSNNLIFKKWLLLSNTSIKKFVFLSSKSQHLYIKNGLNSNLTWFRPNSIPVPESLNIKKLDIKNVVLLNLAKFMPRKNQLFLIEVLNLLPLNYSLILAGPLEKNGQNVKRDFNYFDQIKKLIHEYKLQKRVKLVTNFILKPEHLYREADIFLFPSFNEALGTPILEALSYGIPVIANSTSSSSFNDWILPQNNGFLCDNNPNEWVKKIENCLNFSELQRKNFSNKILNKASDNIIDQEYNNIFNEIINS